MTTNATNLVNPDVATNGDTWADSGAGAEREFTYTTAGALSYLQVDLGEAYPVNMIKVFHYSGRTYNSTKTQISAGGNTWTTVFDSAVSGTYLETAEGKTHNFAQQNVCYVRYSEWMAVKSTAAVRSKVAVKSTVAIRIGSMLNFLLADPSSARLSRSTYATLDMLSSLSDAFFNRLPEHSVFSCAPWLSPISLAQQAPSPVAPVDPAQSRYNYLMIQTHFILYVADQTRSAAFYTQTLACQPTLDVPGMTEFTLQPGCIIGLMPAAGIQRLLGPALPDPSPGAMSARAEIYLLVDDPLAYHQRALAAGARQLSGLQPRDWGHRAAYSLDPDGYVLAFAAVEG